MGINDYANNKYSFTKIYDLKGKILQVATNHESYYSHRDYQFTIILTSSAIYGCGGNEYSQLGSKQNYRTETYESGLIFKDKHETKHYFEKKPKLINELANYVNGGGNFKISCDKNSSYLYNFSEQKIYIQGDNNSTIITKVL